jgi:hypothetical protein
MSNAFLRILGVKKNGKTKDKNDSPTVSNTPPSPTIIPSGTPPESKPEIKPEKDADQDESQEAYNDALKKLEKRTTNVDDYAEIMQEDDDTSRLAAHAATEEEIDKEIQRLCGPKKEWCREEEEAVHFRSGIKAYVYISHFNNI